MFNWYEMIFNYYKLGLYTADDLDVFVLSGWITDEEKMKIIGG